MTSDAARTESGEDGLLDALVQTSYAVVDAVTAVAVRRDLSLTLWRLLAILRDRAPTMSELATHLGLDRSTITGLVDRAAARGLMQRTTDAHDRRSSRVTLTGPGRELAQACAAELTRELAPMTTQLSPAERGQLVRLLAALGSVR